MSYLDSFKTFIENPRSMSGNKYVRTDFFFLQEEQQQRSSVQEHLLLFQRAFVTLKVSTLQCGGAGSWFLMKAQQVIFLGSANSQHGILSRELHTGSTCAGPARRCAGSPGRALQLLAEKPKIVPKSTGSPSAVCEMSYVWDLGKPRGKFM